MWTGHGIVRLRRGVPQGSPLSPLLANYFLGDLDRELEKCESRLIRYADDFVVLAKSSAAANAALDIVKRTLAALKLDLQMEKTHLTTFDEGFKFLGATFWRGEIFLPWKEDRRKPHVLFVARPMPARMIHMYQSTSPPRTGMEEAFRKANIGKVETRKTGTVNMFPKAEHDGCPRFPLKARFCAKRATASWWRRKIAS